MSNNRGVRFYKIMPGLQPITVLSTVWAQERKIREAEYAGDGRSGSVGGLVTFWKEENEFG
jgi:hypothetical protein